MKNIKKKLLTFCLLASCLFVGRVNADTQNIELKVGESVLVDSTYGLGKACNINSAPDDHRNYYNLIKIEDGKCLLTGKSVTSSTLTGLNVAGPSDTSGDAYTVTVIAGPTGNAIVNFVNTINTDNYYKPILGNALKANWVSYWKEYKELETTPTVGTDTFYLDAAYYATGSEYVGDLYIQYGFDTRYILVKASGIEPRTTCVGVEGACSTEYASLWIMGNADIGDDILAKKLFFFLMESTTGFEDAKSLITTDAQMLEFISNNPSLGSYTESPGIVFGAVYVMDGKFASTVKEKLTPVDDDGKKEADDPTEDDKKKQTDDTNPNTGASITFVVFMGIMLAFIALFSRNNKKIYKI